MDVRVGKDTSDVRDPRGTPGDGGLPTSRARRVIEAGGARTEKKVSLERWLPDLMGLFSRTERVNKDQLDEQVEMDGLGIAGRKEGKVTRVSPERRGSRDTLATMGTMDLWGPSAGPVLMDPRDTRERRVARGSLDKRDTQVRPPVVIEGCRGCGDVRGPRARLVCGEAWAGRVKLGTPETLDHMVTLGSRDPEVR